MCLCERVKKRHSEHDKATEQSKQIKSLRGKMGRMREGTSNRGVGGCRIGTMRRQMGWKN